MVFSFDAANQNEMQFPHEFSKQNIIARNYLLISINEWFITWYENANKQVQQFHISI